MKNKLNEFLLICLLLISSGVAVLSCTDCSGSSTSSDITDPGSPFSTASSHSEDSGSAQQPAKMPPTQTAHHPPWLWTADEEPPSCKRPFEEKTAFPKRLKSSSNKEMDKNKQSLTTTRTTQNSNKSQQNFIKLVTSESKASDKILNHNNNNSTNCKIKKLSENSKMQQGKITEYFRSQTKSIKKEGYTFGKHNGAKKTSLNKFISLVDQQTQFNSLKVHTPRKEIKMTASKKAVTAKTKKSIPSMTVPRKILPAPSHTDKMTIDEQLNNLANFTPTVTLTAFHRIIRTSTLKLRNQLRLRFSSSSSQR